MLFYFILTLLLLFKHAIQKVEIIKDEFQTKSIDASKIEGWSSKNTLTCPLTTTHEYSGDIFGPFFKDVPLNTKTYSNLPPHWSVSFKADLMIYGSVDSGSGEYAELVLDNQQSKASRYTKAYYEGYQICENIKQTFDGNIFKEYYFNDKIFPFYQNITHIASTFVIKINSYFVRKFGNLLSDNEGYALKYIQVAVDTCFPTCAACNGPTISQCTACPSGSVLKNGKCFCSGGKIAHQYQCVSSCPSGYTPDNTNTYCDLASCNINCQTCNTSTKICTLCKTGYYLLEGGCVQSCPAVYTKQIGSVCQDQNINNSPVRVYVLKALFEDVFTESDLIKYSFVLTGFPSSGGKIRLCGNKSVLGGFMIASQSTQIKKSVTGLDPHFSLKFGFSLYLIDYWKSTFTSKEGQITVIYGSSDTKQQLNRNGESGKHLCGQTQYDDYIYNFSKEIPHTEASFSFTLIPDMPWNIYDQNFAVRDIFILIEKCPNTCTSCTSATVCTACQQGLQLVAGVCKTCPAGFYANNNICTPCNSECKTCIGGTNKHCTSCQQAKPYLINFSCDTTCPSGQAPDENNICQLCHEICLSCSAPGLDNTCKSCSGNLHLEGSNCVEQCVDGFVGINNLCVKCDNSCNTCSNSITECVTCPTGKVFQNKQCLDKCLDGFYNEGGICTKCNDECSKCDGALAANCTSCTGNTSLFQGKCISVCPDQTVSLTNECQKCYEGCNKCQGIEQNKCQECVDGYFFADTNECLKQCPINYFNDMKTKKCTPCYTTCSKCITQDSTQCTKCKAGYFLTNNQCKSTCPLGQYGNTATLSCEKCNDDCKGCSGPSSNECNQCNVGNFLNPDFTCKDNCPETFFSNVLTNTCDKCEPPCNQCAEKATLCLSCQTGFLFKKDCPVSCPNGYFENSSNNSCEACSGNCKTCQGSSTFCLTCVDKTYLYKNTCLETCEKGFYADNASLQCQNCHISCTTCLGSSEQDCTSCNGEFYDPTNSIHCQANCPDKYFGNTINMQCEQCDPSCKTCTGKLSNQCTICEDGKIFLQGYCLDKCPDRYFQDGNNCTICHSDCFNCSDKNQNSCTACIDDKYLNDSTCVQACPITKFKNNSNNKCEECNNCYSCLGPNPTDCLTCQGLYFLNPDRSCQQNCPNHYFKDTKTNICEECSDQCKECSGNAQSCDQCNEPTFLDTVKRICVEVCPKTYFQDVSNRQCEKCESSCYECDERKDKCISCEGDKLLTAVNTCKSSCDEGYFPIMSQNICGKCDSNCKNCQDSPTNCIECPSDKFLLKNQCVLNCPDGTFSDQQRQCQKCNENCFTCENKNNFCLTCDQDKQLFLNPFDRTCVSSCPLKTFPNKTSYECNLCHTSCLTCSSPDENQCLSCETTHFYEGKCIPDCPEHFFQNKNNVCQKCNDKCSSCFDEMENNCKSCYPGFFLDKNDNSCREPVDCPQRTFANPLNGLCDKCHLSCSKCDGTSEDSCLQCSLDLLFYKNKCYKTCPINTYKNGTICSDCHSSCSQCTDSQEMSCLLCSNNENGKCIDKCSDNYYLDSSNIQQKLCKICSNQCLGCSGPSENECTSCSSPKYLQSFKCVNQCSSNYITDETNRKCSKCVGTQVRYQNNCIVSCPSKTYEYDQECYECGQNCDTCDQNGCSTCSQSFFNQQGNCKSECDKNFYSQNYNCLKCSTSCNECLGSSDKQCKNCVKDKYLLNGECLIDCPKSYFKDQDKCTSCDSSCFECNGSATYCTKCKNNEGIYQNKCYKDAPPKTYLDNEEFKPCHTSCESCKGGLETNCTACKATDFMLESSRCVEKCPEGYLEEKLQMICTECEENCSICISQKECKKCKNGFYLDNAKCVQKCQDVKQYQDELLQKCFNCHASCKDRGCSGVEEKDCNNEGDDIIAIGESIMFKIFIGQTVIFSVITVYGFFKDKKDEKHQKRSQVASSHPPRIGGDRSGSNDNSSKGEIQGEKNQVQATQLKTNYEQTMRIKRKPKTKVYPSAQFTSVAELDDRNLQQTQADGAITPKPNNESQIMINPRSNMNSSNQILTNQNLNEDGSPLKRENSKLISDQRLDLKASHEVLPTFSNHQELAKIPYDESTSTEDKDVDKNQISRINKKALYYVMLTRRLIQKLDRA